MRTTDNDKQVYAAIHHIIYDKREKVTAYALSKETGLQSIQVRRSLEKLVKQAENNE